MGTDGEREKNGLRVAEAALEHAVLAPGVQISIGFPSRKMIGRTCDSGTVIVSARKGRHRFIKPRNRSWHYRQRTIRWKRRLRPPLI